MKEKIAEGGSSTVTMYPHDVRIITEVALLEQSICHINQTLIRIEKSILDVNVNVNDIRKEMKNDFRFLITAICSLAAVMAHGFHWL